MVKKYVPVCDEQRKELIRLIYEELNTIKCAARKLGIYYPTAKAINKVYEREKRTDKLKKRLRTRKIPNDDSSEPIKPLMKEQEI